MTLVIPYVKEIEKMKIRNKATIQDNSDMVQFSKDLELYFGKFCFNS